MTKELKEALDRALSAAEVAANYAVDKARFNLPAITNAPVEAVEHITAGGGL